MKSPIKVQRPGDYPRKYIPQDADLGEWEQLESILNEMNATKFKNVRDLQKWFRQNSELSACFDEEASRRYIEMTCATNDSNLEERYMHMVQNIFPRLKPIANQLEQKYFKSKFRKQLNRKKFELHDKHIATDLKLFQEKNIPIEKELSELSQQYQKINGAMTVKYEGEEKTLQQMSIYLESKDRKVRKKTWSLVAKRRLKDRESLNRIFGKMVKKRDQIAKNSGYKNYLEYIFPKKKRFDYTPKHCIDFHNAVEKCAVPFMRKLDAERKMKLNLKQLRPWDLSVDPDGHEPLRPFKSGKELSRKCLKVFQQVDPQLAEQFEMMIQKGLLELESRKGKAPGGYQSTLAEVRLPFIFMNAAGTDRDVSTLIHEAGHAFHAIAARDQDIYEYRHGPMEFCEVASMGMELICCDKLKPFYNKTDAARSMRKQLEGAIVFFPWCATIDAFQHWIYQNPNHTSAQRTKYWLHLIDRFGHDIDWSGLEKNKESTWHRQLHLFEVPFYYIEYGIAQLGALQLWMNYRKNPEKALGQYKRALALGGSKPLPILFKTAGLKFDFSEKTLAPIVAEVKKALEELPR